MITINDALRILQNAKLKIGGDKCLILSLTSSGIEDADVTDMFIIKEDESQFVQVRVSHPSLIRKFL